MTGPAVIRDNLTWSNGGDHGIDLCAGWEGSNGNIVADPYFCGPEMGVYTLAEDSPALTHPAGPLGALPNAGCGPVAIHSTTWGRIKAKYRSGP